MAKTMTTSAPQPMGTRQIDRAVEIFRAQLTSHASEFPSDAIQQVFGQSELGPELLAVIRRRVEAIGRTYELEINYDDPRWKSIDPSDYAFVGDVTAVDYPISNTGKRKVRFQELVFDHEPFDAEVLAEMEKQGCRQPDRAETETVIRTRYTREELAANPRVGITGPAVQRCGYIDRACVRGYGGGVRLRWRWTGPRWLPQCRFVVVRK